MRSGAVATSSLDASMASLVATSASWTTRSRCLARRRPNTATASKPSISRRDPDRRVLGIEGSDRPDAAATGDERLPRPFDVQAERADRPHARHDHSAVVHSPGILRGPTVRRVVVPTWAARSSSRGAADVLIPSRTHLSHRTSAANLYGHRV